MSPRGRVPAYIPALLISASCVSILSTDLYTPSLPHLQDYFRADAAEVQLTMSLNLAGFALAQLIFGPLSDRFGRRPIFVGGMVGFALASLACALAPSLDSLILARTLQGITACAESVIALAIIRELYDETGAVRILGIYGMAIAVAPAIGPIIGGQMHVWFGWRSNFFLLTLLVVVVALLIYRYLPETLEHPDRDAIRPSRLVGGYLALVSNRPFVTYILVSGLTLAALFAFVTEAPFVYIERMGVATEDYGFYYAGIVLAYFLGSLAVTGAAGRLAIDGLLFIGLLICAASGVIMLGLIAIGSETPVSVTLTFSLYAFGLGLIMATAPVRAFDVSHGAHGFAAASLGAAEMGGGGVGALAVGLLHDGTSWPMATTIFGALVLALALYALARPWRVRSAQPEALS